MGDKEEKQITTTTSLDQNPLEESTHENQAIVVSNKPSSFISSTTPTPTPTPLYINPNTSTTIELPYHHDQTILNPKRPKYEWKILPSPHHQQQQQQQKSSSSSLVIINKDPQVLLVPPQTQTQTQTTTNTGSSSSPTTSSHSPSQSPLQLRKGKYVSPVWKPNEMLWLARAWRIQYQRGGGGGGGGGDHDVNVSVSSSRGKTRAEKDREVAEFLNRNGVNRDAKTSGTKWDNMLGEFRKVYEWERGGEGEQVGKSYFRLSPYERKIHRLPASFDEDVYNELSQFMGTRVRASHSRSLAAAHDHNNGLISPTALTTTTITTTLPPLPPPPPPLPPFKEDDHMLPLSEIRSKQGIMESGGREILFGGGIDSLAQVIAPSSSTTAAPVRRIGRIRMTWEESLSLWAEDNQGDHNHHHQQQIQRGRVKLEGMSFLNADEITFFDESMVGCTMEAFEDGPLKGFSVDRFVCGQQVKVFGRRKSSYAAASTSSAIPPLEYQDPSDYYLGCLRAATPTTLPTLFELSWHLQDPPPEDLRFPLHKDIYRDLPLGKDLFFTTMNQTTTSSDQLLDCRAFAFDVLSPILRSNPSLSISTSSSRDSYIPLWDDCINRLVSKFCSLEMVIVRKPTFTTTTENLQDQWPNVTGFVRNFCLWRGEEIDQLREGNLDPSTSIVEKVLWTYMDVPYILGYYAVGSLVTFCALSRSQDRVIRTDLYSVDLSTPTERLKSLIPCWRIACLLPLLAERCYKGNTFCYSDFERLDLGGGNATEMTPNTVKHLFSSRRKWVSVKEIYDFLDRRIPHSEYIFRVSEKDLTLTFKPRGYKSKPTNCEQLVEALKFVTKALVALHDLSFMHRDLCWEKVMRRSDRENEWYVSGFEEAVGAPQIYPNVGLVGPRFAPEMGRGLHGVKVDVWGVGHLIKSSGLVVVPILLRELQNRCLDSNPEQRPTAADCYHHLLQLQSSLSVVAPGTGVGGY